MRRKVLVLGIALLLVGCGSKETSESKDKTETKQEIAVVVENEPSTLDSSLASDTYGITLLNNVMEGLYRLDENNQLVTAGASELPAVSDDLLTYKIKLNKEAKWSNDTPVTAGDYVYAWQKAVNPETGSEYSYLFSSILNATEIIEGKKKIAELGIKAIDDYELEITLAQATPYFDSLLAFPTFFPQNQAFVEKEAADYAKTSKNLIYNGPFVLEEFDGAGTDTDWTYVKSKTYWDNKNVKLAKISNQVIKEPGTSVKLFEAGEIDDLPLSGEFAQQYKGNEAFVSLDKAGTTYLSYDQREGLFTNAKARKAISLVLNREEIIENILADGSLVPKGLVPSGMSFAPETNEDFADATTNYVKTDVEEAKKLWQEAKTESKTGDVTLELLSYDVDSIRKLAEAIQFAIEDNLEGTKVNVSIVPVSVAVEKGRNTEFDLFLFGWGADYADPSSFLDLFKTDSPYNYGKYSNKEYDALVESAGTTNVTDPEKRWSDFVEAENLLLGETGVNPIFQKAESRLRNPQLKGIISHSVGAQFDFKEAYLED
ncbi:peptide ABC transporter substrate-binding protein [Vagococcus sp. BWB3-3]|uniref:Peptide ABC transporter substrate-binding protein n=1 Tax=Vagococcus allomyrinae TaxID=2794353 RepID=A0A940P700_9ENTE|nr:peptide ABC transporter substrate-binding protein [Vagococcus allomyrinae]MBP1042230.1 peptide ABC transporter substrate-binding protein [Vagococcus allomyrinae]